VERADAGAASGVIGTMQRIGSATGIAIIGTVLFGTLHVVPGPDAVALAFGHSARLAMAVSAALSIAAFGLVFALPTTAHEASDGKHRLAAGRSASDARTRISAQT
jgi:hypothetical protein